MASIKVSTEDFIKLQLANAKQEGVEFQGDVKIYREMALTKKIEVYKCTENGGFVATKKYKIDKVRIAPDSINIIAIVSDKGDVLSVDEVNIDRDEAKIKYCEKLIDEGNSLIRKGTGALLQMVKLASK